MIDITSIFGPMLTHRPMVCFKEQISSKLRFLVTELKEALPTSEIGEQQTSSP